MDFQDHPLAFWLLSSLRRYDVLFSGFIQLRRLLFVLADVWWAPHPIRAVYFRRCNISR